MKWLSSCLWLLLFTAATLSVGWSAETTTTTNVDLDRLIACLEQVENGSGLGGILCIQPALWRETTSQPYGLSRVNTLCRQIGKLALQATINRMNRQGLRVTVDRLALRWRWGYAGMLGRLNTVDHYSQRVSNLYYDASFP